MAHSAAPAAKHAIKLRQLGRSGMMVSELCLGAMTFGESSWGMPTATKEESFALMDRFVSQGGNFIDTADVYGSGNSESIIGAWLQNRPSGFREKLVIATKGRMRMNQTDPNSIGLSRKHLIPAVESSMKRLGLDYIDVYQTHSWDPVTPVEETMRTLNDLIRAGKIRYIGCSNVKGYQLQKIQDLACHMGLEKYISVQAQYHLLCRTVELEVVPCAAEMGMSLLPWSPLAGGWLTGRYKRGEKPENGGRVEHSTKTGWAATGWTRHNNDKTWALLDVIQGIAKAHNRSMAQVSLRWLMQKPTVASVVLGARTLSQLEDNLKASEFVLTDADMKALDAASAVEAFYPYDLPEMNKRDAWGNIPWETARVPASTSPTY
jgi:aryl-alcohol dehydrogenase-like predicted oxidoreductase